MADFRSPPPGAILITGASRGIGKAIARRLVAMGRGIVVNYRSDAAAAQEVAAWLRAKGVESSALQADVSRPDAARELFARAETLLGPVSIVVNNAGITRDQLLLRMSDEDWHATWNTDLAGPRALAVCAARAMAARRGGRMVNISSVVGATGNAGQANYAAAKAALHGLTRDLAARHAAENVLVNCVVPGYFITDATSHLTEEQRQHWLRRIPINRFAMAEEAADLVAFLVGPGGSYITGQCIGVDGGYLAAAEEALPRLREWRR